MLSLLLRDRLAVGFCCLTCFFRVFSLLQASIAWMARHGTAFFPLRSPSFLSALPASSTLAIASAVAARKSLCPLFYVSK